MIEQFGYIFALLFSLIGLAIIDHRFSLALFKDARATAICISLGVLFFLGWDILGVMSGIFFIGSSPYLLGVNVLPDVPIEELFFLCLLCYNTLLLWQGGERLWPRT